MKSNGERYWDFGWQLVEGCTNCSPGCDNCWSLAKEKRFRKETGIVFHSERLGRPLKRKKPASYAIWNDLFHKDVSVRDIDGVFTIIENCRRHIFYVLTKRPERMYKEMSRYGVGAYPQNLYLGVTVCNQREADQKIPWLLHIPAAKRWISIEPMLSYMFIDKNILSHLSWVLVGAESGPHKRYCGRLWIEKIVNDCKKCNVPVFVKQIHVDQSEGGGFRLSKDMSEWPESLRFRQRIEK
jgi:protein gp37